MNAWGLGWRVCYFGAGIVALIFAFLTLFTLKEPERQSIGEDAATQAANPDAKKVTIWYDVFFLLFKYTSLNTLLLFQDSHE